MGRVLTSLFLALCLTQAYPQAFGRFGYTDAPRIPGFDFDRNGFRARSGPADSFKFVRPLQLRRTASTSEHSWYRSGRYAGNPEVVHVNLRAPGFELLCYYGLELKLGSSSGPNLTVGSASYGPGTPAAPGEWVLVTFADAQPPVLLSFFGAKVGMQVTGRSGEWRLKTVKPYKGMVRVCLPFGTEPRLATTVEKLGDLSQQVQANAATWIQPGPVLRSVERTTDETSVKVRFQFDRPGALLPPAYALGKAGGYAMTSSSRIWDTGFFTEEGPIAVCRDSSFEVRLPVRRLNRGRAVAIGDVPMTMPPSSTQPELHGMVSAALSGTVAYSAPAWRTWSQACLDEYLARVAYVTEPVSKADMPFEADGRGMDLAAGAALLTASLSVSTAPQVKNGLLDKVLARFDPMSWSLSSPSEAMTRRASALASVAGLIEGTTGHMVTAAFLHAGLCAGNALQTFRLKTRQTADNAPLVQPLDSLRRALFQPGKDHAFVSVLESPVRILSDQQVNAVALTGEHRMAWRIVGPGERNLRLEIPPDYKVVAGAGARAVGPGIYEPLGNVEGWVSLLTSPGLKPPPTAAAVPTYSE